MMIKKQNYLKHAIVLFLLLLLMQPGRAWAAYENVEFSSLTNHDGLTNSQVGAILKDTREATSGSVPSRDCAALTASV